MNGKGWIRDARRGSTRRRAGQTLLAALVLSTVSGCEYTWQDFPRLGMPYPATEEAPRILSLWQGSWAAALVVGLLVWGLILWAVLFHRRTRTKVEIPPQTRYNMPIEALYTVVPLIIVSVLFYFTARDEAKLLSLSAKPAHTINVVGFQWSWGFNYIEDVDGSAGTGDAKAAPALRVIPARYSAAFPPGAEGVYDVGIPGSRNLQTGNPGPTLWLPKGEKVRFVLTSRDVIHSFWVLPFLMKQDVFPGHNVNVFEVTPSEEGTFRGKCAELCGVDHSRMLFNAKVVSPERYRMHLAALAAAGHRGFIPAGVNIPEPVKNNEPRKL
ncbi:cytochrome c oxidase subunit II [Streptomyces sp. NPDC046866]|uniref:aa3-type cytochrome oxidase subunit II n=1 Tax=Streptomyces sp. NPDC046866 TaxID=3154921 RepID=UPI003453EC6B